MPLPDLVSLSEDLLVGFLCFPKPILLVRFSLLSKHGNPLSFFLLWFPRGAKDPGHYLYRPIEVLDFTGFSQPQEVPGACSPKPGWAAPRTLPDSVVMYSGITAVVGAACLPLSGGDRPPTLQEIRNQEPAIHEALGRSSHLYRRVAAGRLARGARDCNFVYAPEGGRQPADFGRAGVASGFRERELLSSMEDDGRLKPVAGLVSRTAEAGFPWIRIPARDTVMLGGSPTRTS